MIKILLIEDEPLIQKSLKKLLEKRGANVVVESRGREAIQLILNEKFDREDNEVHQHEAKNYLNRQRGRKGSRLQDVSRIRRIKVNPVANNPVPLNLNGNRE